MASPMTFGGFNLPGPAPSTGQNISNAMGQLPGMLNQQQQDKYALQEQKAKAEALSQQQDSARLHFLYRMVDTQQKAGAAVNPAIYDSIEKAAKGLGIGSFMHIDPASGRQVLDMDALKRFSMSKSVEDLTDKEKDDIHATPAGKERDGLFKMYGVNPDEVDKETRDMPAKIDPAKLDRAINQVNNHLKSFAAGGNSIEALKSEIGLAGQFLDRYGIDTSHLLDVVGTKEFSDSLSAGIVIQAQKMRLAGIKEESIIAYQNAKTKEIPLQMQNIRDQIMDRDKGVAIHQEQADTSQSRAQNSAFMALARYTHDVQKDKRVWDHLDVLDKHIQNGDNISANNAQIRAWTQIVGGRQRQLNEIQRQYSTQKAANETPSDDLMKQMTAAQQQVDQANGVLEALGRGAASAPFNRASAAAGKAVRPFVGPPAPGSSRRSSMIPAGAQGGNLQRADGQVIRAYYLPGAPNIWFSADGKNTPLGTDGFPMDSPYSDSL